MGRRATDRRPQDPRETSRRRSGDVLPLAVLVGLPLLVFRGALLSVGERVPLGEDVDVHGYLLDFTARQLRAGHLPLWNPHVFAGLPALGNPNAMTLYPPSLLGVVLPLGAALTISTVLHVVLIGVFTYLWLRHLDLLPLGCLLAALMVSFGAPFFTHIYAGHLSSLAAMTWVPLLLLAIDHLVERRSLGWLAVGTTSVAMQALGGHSQYLFYSALAALGYTFVRLVHAEARGAIAAAVAAMGLAGAGLAAAQLLPVLDAAREGARAGAQPYAFVAEYSMPWSSLLTLLAPGFFGHLAGTTYWGSWLYWEVTPFVGIMGLALAAYGVMRGDRRQSRGALVLALGFLWLALGANTPLLALLHAFVPPFDRFRCCGRALFYFSLFAALLAAVGFDALVRERRPSRPIVVVLLCAAIGLVAFAGFAWWSSGGKDLAGLRPSIERMLRLPRAERELEVRRLAGDDAGWAERLRRLSAAHDAVEVAGGAPTPEAAKAYREAVAAALEINLWQTFRVWIVSTESHAIPIKVWADPAAGRRAAEVAAKGLLVGAATCVLAALLLRRASTSPNAARALAIVGMVEMAVFALAATGSFAMSRRRLAPLEAFHRAHPGDHRVHVRRLMNSAMSLGVNDIWGYDPLVPARYADYMAFTQGFDRRGTGDVFFRLRLLHSSYRMLRLRYALEQDRGSVHLLAEPPRIAEPMPHLALLGDYEVIPDRDALFARLDSPAWDPTRTVLLESEPSPRPAGHLDGTVRLLDSSTDHLTIEAELADPALLLVTDAYSRDWRVRPLEPSSQTRYDVLPANYVLRAVPLAAGHHRLRMEYRPRHYYLGLCLSLIVLTVAAGACCSQLWHAARRRAAGGPSPAVG